MPENKARTFEHAQPIREHARGDSLDLSPKHPKAHLSVVAEHPKNVERPGSREQLEQPADSAGGWDLRGSLWRRHVDTGLLLSSCKVKNL